MFIIHLKWAFEDIITIFYLYIHCVVSLTHIDFKDRLLLQMFVAVLISRKKSRCAKSYYYLLPLQLQFIVELHFFVKRKGKGFFMLCGAKESLTLMFEESVYVVQCTLPRTISAAARNRFSDRRRQQLCFCSVVLLDSSSNYNFW